MIDALVSPTVSLGGMFYRQRFEKELQKEH